VFDTNLHDKRKELQEDEEKDLEDNCKRTDYATRCMIRPLFPNDQLSIVGLGPRAPPKCHRDQAGARGHCREIKRRRRLSEDGVAWCHEGGRSERKMGGRKSDTMKSGRWEGRERRIVAGTPCSPRTFESR